MGFPEVVCVGAFIFNPVIFIVANVSRHAGSAICFFKVKGMQPELWDPVTGIMSKLQQYEIEQNGISVPILFDTAQSFFIIFRKKIDALKSNGKKNFPEISVVSTLQGSWNVQFDPLWGGPSKPVTFTGLTDWTNNNIQGIKYYSGTAIYKKAFDFNPTGPGDANALYLNLGNVKHIASVKLNGRDLGIVWTAPWRTKIPKGLLKAKGNQLEIEVTNVWANRLIGDEQEPPDCEWIPGYISGGFSLKEFPEWFLKKEQRPSKGRYCFTTWNYFTKDSPLVASGLFGPVTIMKENEY